MFIFNERTIRAKLLGRSEVLPACRQAGTTKLRAHMEVMIVPSDEFRNLNGSAFAKATRGTPSPSRAKRVSMAKRACTAKPFIK